MATSPLRGLVIRTAVVTRPTVGYIYACDRKKEAKGIGHAVVFRWEAGKFTRSDDEYDAHSACVIDDPEPALVDVSEPGYYSAVSKSGAVTEDIFEKSEPPPKKPRARGIRSVSEIAGKAYAVGYKGMVYRLDKFTRWTRIDDGLPETFDIEAAHGFKDGEIYAAGLKGRLWEYDGKRWRERTLPTNAHLACVRCAGDGKVYIGGKGGMLLRGRNDAWEVIDHGVTDEDIWDIDWFDGGVYASTVETVYRLNGNTLDPVNFGSDCPKTCYQLSTTKGVMWSNGEDDVMSFDGRRWTRIV